MESSKKSVAIAWSLAIIVLLQNPPWFLWDNYYVFLIVFVFILYLLCFSRLFLRQKLFFKFFSFVIILSLFFILFSSLNQFRISSIVTVLTFSLLFAIKQDEKVLALKYLTKCLSIIIFISFVAWQINILIDVFPFQYLNYGSGKGDEGGTILKNYFFFIQEDRVGFNRFYSIFDEPGVVGTLAAFILFANGYNFRIKHNIIIFIGAVFTFSLAFFVITALGLILFNVRKDFGIIKAFIFLNVILLGIYFLLESNETFQNVVLYRFSNISTSGIDSRTSDLLNSYYSQYIFSLDSIFGKGTSFFEENKQLLSGQGYKLFLIEYGLVGFLLVLLMYVFLLARPFRLGYFCLIVFLASFLQRPFLFTPWQIIMFSISIESLYYSSIIRNNAMNRLVDRT